MLGRAREFVLRNARVLDRHRFAFLFENESAEPVLAALRAYRNDDGGFGHALEPDLRGAASQPVPLEHALAILDEVDRFDAELVEGACEWLDSITTPGGGVPFVLPNVTEAPSEAAVLEWRGVVTVAALGVLRGYGRLDEAPQTSR